MITEIAIVQVEGRGAEPAAARLERGLQLLNTLDRPVGLAVFPELWTVGYFNFAQYATVAEPVPGPLTARFSEAARRAGTWLHAGSVIECTPERILFNTSVLFDSQGQLRAVYRKIHLFGYQSEEKELLQPGVDPVVVSTRFGHIGLATCYDLRFPELFRILTARGAEAFVVVSAWPQDRLDHWLVLARARAVENLAYVIGCNMCGIVGNTRLAGHSLVVDPWGMPVAAAEDEEQVLHARVDWARVRDLRRRFPALADRRL